MSLRFSGRVLFIKDVIGSSEICCWTFYGQGRKMAEVCCHSIVYTTDKKHTKVSIKASNNITAIFSNQIKKMFSFLSGWIPRGSDIRGNVKHSVVRASEWPGSRINAGYIITWRGTMYIRWRRGFAALRAFRLGSPSLQQTKHQLTQSCSSQSTAYRDSQRRSLVQDANKYKINTKHRCTSNTNVTYLIIVSQISFFLFVFMRGVIGVAMRETKWFIVRSKLTIVFLTF